MHMKQYVIDEIRATEHEKIRRYLDDTYGEASLDGLYWIPLVDYLLNDVQHAHTECHPFFFALELQPERLCCELLIRTRQRMRCDCIGYANPAQRNWIVDVIDAMFEKLGLKT